MLSVLSLILSDCVMQQMGCADLLLLLLQERLGQQELENGELISYIQTLEKEISSSSVAKEKETLRRDLEKAKTRLKETESKLKIAMQEKTKLEVFLLYSRVFWFHYNLLLILFRNIFCRVRKLVLNERSNGCMVRTLFLNAISVNVIHLLVEDVIQLLKRVQRCLILKDRRVLHFLW
jgi:hypothetical protein